MKAGSSPACSDVLPVSYSVVSNAPECDVENPLSKLVLDYWYKVIILVCILVFLLSGAGLLPNLPVIPTALISLGGFFLGLGEWINHPLQVGLVYRFKITRYRRYPSFAGQLFDLLGLALIGYGLYRIFQ